MTSSYFDGCHAIDGTEEAKIFKLANLTRVIIRNTVGSDSRGMGAATVADEAES